MGVALVLVFAMFAEAGAGSFERAEERESRDHYNPPKRPCFGETHIHTAYSFDTVYRWTRNMSADGYRYAKGHRVGLPPCLEVAPVSPGRL